MAYFLVKTLYSILFLLSFSFIGCCSGNHELRKEEREFDYFLLAYLWPGTICPRTKQCCSMNACCRGSLSPTEFTIHGLWTDYNDGTWPACCRESYFDIKKISSLLGTLEKYWPTFGCAPSSNCHGGKGLFWEHEWEKHGTCSSPVILDEYNYFSTTLDLYFKYNITKIMNNAGYVPSNTKKYRLKSIISTIQNAVGSSPLLVCSGDAVEELRLCFTKDMLTRECVGSSSCPKYISIPEYTPMDKSQVLDVSTF